MYKLCINVQTTCHPENGTKSPTAPDTFRPNSSMYVRVAEDMGHALLLVLCIPVYHRIGQSKHMVISLNIATMATRMCAECVTLHC